MVVYKTTIVLRPGYSGSHWHRRKDVYEFSSIPKIQVSLFFETE